MGAIRVVRQEVEKVWSGNHRSRKVAVLFTFDVKNSFNALRWTDILDALGMRHQVSLCLRRVISDKLKDREL